VATEAAWLNGNNLEKEETKKKKEKMKKNERKDLTLTGLLMEGVRIFLIRFCVRKALRRQLELFAEVAATDGQLGVVNLRENPDAWTSETIVEQLAAEAKDQSKLYSRQKQAFAYAVHGVVTMRAMSLRRVTSRT
jgi:hypothetical protein